MTKKKPKSEHKKDGRPTIMTNIVIGKLEQMFLANATNAEACIFAGICQDTLYDYKKKNPVFADKMKLLRAQRNLFAKRNIFKAIKEKEDINVSRWVLEKTDPEYSNKLDIKADIDAKLTTEINVISVANEEEVKIARKLIGKKEDE